MQLVKGIRKNPVRGKKLNSLKCTWYYCCNVFLFCFGGRRWRCFGCCRRGPSRRCATCVRSTSCRSPARRWATRLGAGVGSSTRYRCAFERSRPRSLPDAAVSPSLPGRPRSLGDDALHRLHCIRRVGDTVGRRYSSSSYIVLDK